MREDTLRKIRAFLIERVQNRRLREYIHRFGERLIRIVGAITVFSAIITFTATGTEFFTKTIPNILVVVSRAVLLAGTLRPTLVEHVVRNDLGYEGLCSGRSIVIDLDQDGHATDLIVPLYPRRQRGDAFSCAYDAEEEGEYPTYAVLKEIHWSSFWPKYTLLHALNPGVAGALVYALGPYVIAATPASHNPANRVYAYAAANGTLKPFGTFHGKDGADPVLQAGGQLFLKTPEGLRIFELSVTGEPNSHIMSTAEIIRRNNTTLVIEDEDHLSEEAKAEIEKIRLSEYGNWMLQGGYKKTTDSSKMCNDISVFGNGESISFSMKDQKIKLLGRDTSRIDYANHFNS